LCERFQRKFEVSDRLSRANGLFQPLRRLAFTAPGITIRATVATDVRFRRPRRQEGSEVIGTDAEVIHAVAEICNHAVPFPFVHQAFLSSVLPVLLSSSEAGDHGADMSFDPGRSSM
jgi:hypothetical protein